MSKKQTEKPLTMIINELKAKIEMAISESNLPACIIEPIMCNYLLQLRATADAQARIEKENYEKSSDEEEEAE